MDLLFSAYLMCRPFCAHRPDILKKYEGLIQFPMTSFQDFKEKGNQLTRYLVTFIVATFLRIIK